MGRYGEIRGEQLVQPAWRGHEELRRLREIRGDMWRYVEIRGAPAPCARERVRESDHEALHGGAALATESQSIRVVSTATQAPAPCAAAPPAPPSARRRRLRRFGRRTERRSGRPEGRQRAEADQIWGDIGRYGEIRAEADQSRDASTSLGHLWARLQLGSLPRLSISAVPLGCLSVTLLSAGSRLPLGCLSTVSPLSLGYLSPRSRSGRRARVSGRERGRAGPPPP